MSASFRVRCGTSAVVLLLATGWLSSVALSDDGASDSLSGGQWIWDAQDAPEIEPDRVPWFTIRVNALFLNRRPPPSNIVLSNSATGATLLDTANNDPSWAGGTEVNFLMSFSDTTSFEFDWFSVDDWFDKQTIQMAPIAVDQVPFLVTDAASSVSTRIRNMEFNLREEVYHGVTLLAGFRYLELLDTQRVHYLSAPFGTSEKFTNDVANRMYGVQMGTQLDIWESECWDLSAWGKVGVFGNAAGNSSGVSSSIPIDNVTIRAQDGKTAFAGELGVRGTRRFGDHVSIFLGYRLLYLDGIALAGTQYPGTLVYMDTGFPSIKMGNSILFQGIEAGLSFAF